MKTWTVVVEVKDPSDSFTKSEIEELFDVLDGGSKFAGDLYKQVFECTEAPYGPQGVVLSIARTKEPFVVGRAGRVQTAPKEGGK